MCFSLPFCNFLRLMIVVCFFLNVIVMECFGVYLPLLETTLIEQSSYLFLFVKSFQWSRTIILETLPLSYTRILNMCHLNNQVLCTWFSFYGTIHYYCFKLGYISIIPCPVQMEQLVRFCQLDLRSLNLSIGMVCKFWKHGFCFLCYTFSLKFSTLLDYD